MVGLAVVDQPQVVVAVLVQQRPRLLDVDVAAQDVRDLAALRVGGVGLEPPSVALEQQSGAPEAAIRSWASGSASQWHLVADGEAAPASKM